MLISQRLPKNLNELDRLHIYLSLKQNHIILYSSSSSFSFLFLNQDPKSTLLKNFFKTKLSNRGLILCLLIISLSIMGLSTKLVSTDDHGLDNIQNSLQELPKPPPIRRQPTSKPEPLNCPRCGSINTKFCYYNNYNKSQPRHYCKGCKRHWTEGGTLRNVPVGGGRKNKRARRTDHPIDHITGRKYVTLEVNDPRCPLITTTITTPTTSNVSSYTIRGNSFVDEGKKEYDIFYETLNIPSSSLPFDQTQFSFSSIGYVPCSVPDYVQSSNAYEYMGKFDNTMEESTITTVMPITSSSSFSQSWQVQETSNLIETMPSTYWNWNEIDTLSAADLNIPWDDLEIKP